MKYHKIDTVYKRAKDDSLIMGDWSKPEFAYLADGKWELTEKVDGTNIQIFWDGKQPKFMGREDSDEIVPHLLEKLAEMFPAEKLLNVFGNRGNLWLYGEGYGYDTSANGHHYLPDSVSFILYDVMGWDRDRELYTYFTREMVYRTAEKLGIDHVPVIGIGTLFDAISITRKGMVSRLATTHAEGLVMRPVIELRNNRGDRIISKIKLRDFK